MMKKKKMIFDLDEPQTAMLEKLKGRFGGSYASIMRMSLMHFYGKNFKDYLEFKREAFENRLNPEEMEVKKIKIEKIREETRTREEYDQGHRICELLGGTEYKEGDYWYCKWEVYDMLNPNFVETRYMTMPFDELDEEMVEQKYMGGTKEQIEEVRARKAN